ncbi:telomere binding protein [Agyrium rufum]|nr:telomere binding protein [Agyrium rufum]
MDEILVPSRTRKKDAVDLKPLTPKAQAQDLQDTEDRIIDSLDDACYVLDSKPLLESVLKVLQWVQSNDTTYKWHVPSPKAARIIALLVNEVITDYWTVIREDDTALSRKIRKLLLRYLKSIAGVGALTQRLRMLLAPGQIQETDAKPASKALQRDVRPIKDVLEVLETILEGKAFLRKIWTDLETADMKPMQRNLAWKELVQSLAGGRVLSIAAEAVTQIQDTSSKVEQPSWVGDGTRYAHWLAENIDALIFLKTAISEEILQAVSNLLIKSMTLGYTNHVVKVVFFDSIVHNRGRMKTIRQLLHSLNSPNQRTIIFSIIQVISENEVTSNLGRHSLSDEQDKKKAIGAVAALLTALTGDKQVSKDVLSEWLTDSLGPSVGSEPLIRRAVLLYAAQDIDQIKKCWGKVLKNFGDSTFVKHAPLLRQEVNTEVLLLLAAYLHRQAPEFLAKSIKSSDYINAISIRISASSTRARLLGMNVANALTNLQDPGGEKEIFKGEDVTGPDAERLQSLVKTQDLMGSLEDLSTFKMTTASTRKKPFEGTPQKTHNPKPTLASSSKIVSIEELSASDSSESFDSDLPTYAKPDTDPEDSDEDPTLITRNKPHAPVYIRDLLAGLRDTENYNRYTLAITTAASLIRRKANFGTEVSEHAEDLATQLTGLGDKYSMKDFEKLRLQGMIAVFVARPEDMGPWFAKAYFSGDYSMGQRASILTTMSLGAREIAGFKTEDEATLTGANLVEANAFPSKRLPEKMHKIWSAAEEAAAQPVAQVTHRMERMMIRPMAADAADKMIGPKALKVRTFSSRMEVEKRRKKVIPNELAKMVADKMFFPLTGRWQAHLASYGTRASQTRPFLLSHFLRTLSLLLHASGPSTLSLPQMTREFWDLLLSLRAVALSDVLVLEALLFGFLTILDLHAERRQVIAEDFSRELLETQKWVQGVFERTEGGSEEGERVRMVCAGVLVGAGEVVEKYRSVVMGGLVAYES